MFQLTAVLKFLKFTFMGTSRLFLSFYSNLNNMKFITLPKVLYILCISQIHYAFLNYFVISVVEIMESSKILLIIGFALTICAIFFQLIGLASPYWLFFNNEGIIFYGGLWKWCSNILTPSTIFCT